MSSLLACTRHRHHDWPATHHLFVSFAFSKVFVCRSTIKALCWYLRIWIANVCWIPNKPGGVNWCCFSHSWQHWQRIISAARFCRRRPDYDWSVWYFTAHVPAVQISGKRSWYRRLTTGIRSSGRLCFTREVKVSVAKSPMCARIRRYHWVRSIGCLSCWSCWQCWRKCQRRCRVLGSFLVNNFELWSIY